MVHVGRSEGFDQGSGSRDREGQIYLRPVFKVNRNQ